MNPATLAAARPHPDTHGTLKAALPIEHPSRLPSPYYCMQPRLMHVCAELSAAAGGPAEGQARGSEQLVRLVGEARDSFLFDRLAQLAAPTTTAEVNLLQVAQIG